MQALSEAEREAVIVRYLAEYRKSLSADQIRRIAGDYKCGHPLFLKTLLEELRLVGRHEDLEDRIDDYLAATGTEDLFQRLLAGIEAVHGTDDVQDTMILLWGARTGLDEGELAELSDLSRLKIASLIVGLDFHLVRKNGRLTFFHDYLRRAVEKRYLSGDEEKRRLYSRLADHFEGVVNRQVAQGEEVDHRYGLELIYQLEQAGEHERLAHALTTIPLFTVLYQGESEYDVLACWTRIPAEVDIESLYRQSLATHSFTGDGERLHAMGLVAGILETTGHREGAIRLLRERIDLAAEIGDRSTEAGARRDLGQILKMRGDDEDARVELERARELFTLLEDPISYARTILILGSLYYVQDRFEPARQHFEESREIFRRHGDRRLEMRAINSIGNLFSSLRRQQESMEYYRLAQGMAREYGDRRLLARVFGNMGQLHMELGEPTEARACLQSQLDISRELGDRQLIAETLSSLVVLHCQRGEFEPATVFLDEQEKICREIGDRRGLIQSFEWRGIIHGSRGEHEPALDAFRHQEALLREAGDRQRLFGTLGNIGVLYRHMGQEEKSLECYRQQEEMADEISDPREIGVLHGNIGVILADRGHYEEALDRLDRACRIHRPMDFFYGLTFWIGRTAEILLDIATDGEPPGPPFLSRYISDADEGTWKEKALALCRRNAEECLEISRRISKPDTLFSSRRTLALLDAAGGETDAATAELQTLLGEAVAEEVRATLHYHLWRLGADGEDHRTEATRLFRSLPRRAGQKKIREHLEEIAPENREQTQGEPGEEQ